MLWLYSRSIFCKKENIYVLRIALGWSKNILYDDRVDYLREQRDIWINSNSEPV